MSEYEKFLGMFGCSPVYITGSSLWYHTRASPPSKGAGLGVR